MSEKFTSDFYTQEHELKKELEERIESVLKVLDEYSEIHSATLTLKESTLLRQLNKMLQGEMPESIPNEVKPSCASPIPIGSQPYRCPVCAGTGLVSVPPGVAGDVGIWASCNTQTYTCRACYGRGVIWH